MDFSVISLIIAIIVINIIWVVIFVRRRPKMVGVITVTRNEDNKLLYSLDLNGNPSDLQYLPFVTFKIDSQV